jgi:hypothetical protein
MSLPTIIKETTYKFLLGIVKVEYLLEDRHSAANVPRYKHYIQVLILGRKKLSWVLRTTTPHSDQPFTN